MLTRGTGAAPGSDIAYRQNRFPTAPAFHHIADADPLRTDWLDMRILIVDDDPDLRDLVTDMLEGAGHEPVAAANGAEALRILHDSGAAGFDLLFTDIMMPVMNGLELARNVAARWPHLPILYVSGHAPDALFQDFSTVPAPVLAKPFRLKPLLEAVEACGSAWQRASRAHQKESLW
jgi:two-component system cell cycle response regulator CpdR